MAEPLIAFDDVRAGYGSAVVLDGVSLALPERGSLAVLGRNGVGKSTLMLTIMGYTQIARGRIAWRGENITRRPPHRRALAGIGWVAQEREILPSRPGEFHPEPLTDPDVTLSCHPARATARRLPPSVENLSSSRYRLALSQRR